MIGGRCSIMKSTSYMVLYRLKLSLTEPCTAVKGTPIALSTCEGSKEPEVHAEPDEAQMPFSFRSNKMPPLPQIQSSYWWCLEGAVFYAHSLWDPALFSVFHSPACPSVVFPVCFSR